MVQKECYNHNATQSMSIIEGNKMAFSEHDECTTSCQNLNEDNKILEHETNEEIDTHFLEDEDNNELQEIDYDTENDAQVIESDNDEKMQKSDCNENDFLISTTHSLDPVILRSTNNNYYERDWQICKERACPFFINEIDYSSTVLHCYDKSSASECSLIDKNQHLLTYEVRSADAALLQETRNLIKSSMEVIYGYDDTDISIDLWGNGNLFSDFERLYFIEDEETSYILFHPKMNNTSHKFIYNKLMRINAKT